MFDFRLRVFYVVAKRLSFTRAAEELFISQPAVSKHIHEIEQHYELKLFERNGTRIRLTKAGATLLENVEKLIQIHHDIDHAFTFQRSDFKGTLIIGASTTVAQYFLPKYIASFKQRFPLIEVSMVSDNTEIIERLLMEGRIDLGIVEGHSKRPNLRYDCLIKDEIVLCTRYGNPTVKKTPMKPEDLKKLRFVLRETGSGSLDVVATHLKTKGLAVNDLHKEMELQDTQSIKSYLLHSDAYAFLSIHAVFNELKDHSLQIIDIKGLEFGRCFFSITSHGDIRKLPEAFLNHLRTFP